ARRGSRTRLARMPGAGAPPSPPTPLPRGERGEKQAAPMKTIAHAAAAPERPRAARTRSLLVFHLGSQAYGLPLHEVQEVLTLAALSRPPGLPSLLAGFLNP